MWGQSSLWVALTGRVGRRGGTPAYAAASGNQGSEVELQPPRKRSRGGTPASCHDGRWARVGGADGPRLGCEKAKSCLVQLICLLER
jgi:hypothetical protein